MMENNWANFLKNLGEWEGSFTSVSLEGELLNSTPSILNLEGLENNQLVRFRLRRFGLSDYSEPPVSDHAQEYRSIGRQNIFFFIQECDRTASTGGLAQRLPEVSHSVYRQVSLILETEAIT